jgi:hypothetical protein
MLDDVFIFMLSYFHSASTSNRISSSVKTAVYAEDMHAWCLHTSEKFSWEALDNMKLIN